jgi:lysozyme family protein
MAYTVAFEKAIDHAMLYEVGGFWKLTPDVEAGLIDTPEQRKACGYTNDPDDHGGETKYGVAKSANTDLNITTLDWEAAKRVYYKRYWLQGDCQDMPPRLAALHFDGCVNHGVGRQAKFLQKAVGAVADGDIGPATLALVNAQDEITLCNKVCAQREAFYRSIVANNPSQAKYLNGWLRRVHEMQAFVTSATNVFE